MKRRLSSIARQLVIAVAAALLLSGLLAFGQNKASLYVPFAFTANHQTLPAGYYTLELLSDQFLCFSNSRTGEHQAVIMVRPEAAPYIETRGRLRFIVNNDSKRHWLSEIQFAGSSIHSKTIMQPSLARELANNPSTASTVDIALNRQK